MPITKEVSGVITYTQKRDLWSSDVTGTFSDKDIAIAADSDPLKQLKFDLDPIPTTTAVTLKGNASTTTDIIVTLPAASGTLSTSGGGSGVGFVTIQTPAGTSPVATGSSDTLTLANGTGISITGDAVTDTVTIAVSGLTKSDVGLGNVDNTSDATKNAAVATLTNKTLTSPVINTPTGIVKGDVGLGNVDNTSDATKNAAVATLTNKTLTSPVINTPTGIVKGDVGLGSVANALQLQAANNLSDLTNTTTARTNLGAQASGNYVTALTGDVTASGPGSVAATIANNATTYAKMQQATAYTMLANSTASTANLAENVFKDLGEQTYASTIVWTGTTAPSGATTHTYRWSQIGKLVNLRINLVYATAGSALTNVTMVLPGDVPQPAATTGLTAASNVLIYGSGGAAAAITTGVANNSKCALANNSGNTAALATIGTPSTNATGAWFNISYWTT